jgi:patatin-like phospholipase/acyl hydrolase
MPGSDLRLLALDGGGVRGLSALMIFKQLIEAVNLDILLKLYNYFNIISRISIRE